MKADLELVDDIRRGNQAAFADLVRRHQTALVRVCARLLRDNELAEDVVQESFVKAFRKLHLFEGRSSFKSWLYQIALNTARNKLRGQKLELVSIDNVQLATSPSAEKTLIMEAVRKRLREAVDELPERQRVALELRIYEDLSFQEIAEMMECPYDTAKANYRHGLLKVKAVLESDLSLREWIGQDEGLMTEIESRLSEVEA